MDETRESIKQGSPGSERNAVFSYIRDSYVSNATSMHLGRIKAPKPGKGPMRQEIGGFQRGVEKTAEHMRY